MAIRIPISIGELVDKITILEIKREHVVEPGPLANVCKELDLLAGILAAEVPMSDALALLMADLREVNRTLWRVEDEIRALERAQDFGAPFIEAARRIYRSNDRRAQIKRRINELVGSDIVEEKNYAAY